MKQQIAITSLAVCIPAVVSAGEMAPAPPSMQSNYAPPSEHVGWFFGAGADYMLDAEEPFYNAHLGYDFGSGHSLLLEAGWLGEEEDPVFPFPTGLDLDIVPITLNYKYEWSFTDRLGLYLGLGAGASNVEISGTFVSDDSWVFTAQAFTGLVYEVSPSFELYAGARYAWLDDVSVAGSSYGDLDDVGVGLGLRFNF